MCIRDSYEYCIGEFASSEGKRGGEFYTPKSVVDTMIEMIEPTKGRVYDPCCGTGGFFVQSERFIDAHAGQSTDIAIYGQERNHTTFGPVSYTHLDVYKRQGW